MARSHLLVVLAFCAILVLGQTKDSTISSNPPAIDWNSLAQPPVPGDPLELVTGPTEPVKTPEARARVLQLLARARYLSNVRSGAYDLKTTFTSVGEPASDGSWTLDDTSSGVGLYRWTARGPKYSVTNLYNNQLLYSDQPAGTAPLRLQQVRTAIFFAYLGPNFIQRTNIRTASSNLNGTTLTCALLSPNDRSPESDKPGRRWNESEYCFDEKLGLLITYSAAPGIYVLYDYSKPLHYNDRTVPGKITITEAGNTVIEAHLESLTDSEDANAEIFKPTSNMTQIGAGSLMTPPWHFVINPSSGPITASSSLQPVIVHGVLTPQGQIAEPEIIQTSNRALNAQALDAVKHWLWEENTAPGATPQQHEAFITVNFIAPGS